LKKFLIVNSEREDELAEPFECYCGSENCYGIVKGYRFLNKTQRDSIKDFVSHELSGKYQLASS
jgi:hypothetical protein